MCEINATLVYLGKATAATRTALPMDCKKGPWRYLSPTCIQDVLVFTCLRYEQSREQHTQRLYEGSMALPESYLYVRWFSAYLHEVWAVTRTALPMDCKKGPWHYLSPTCIRDVLVFICASYEQSQQQRYPWTLRRAHGITCVLLVYEMF